MKTDPGLGPSLGKKGATNYYLYLYVLVSCLLYWGTTLFLPVDPGYKVLLNPGAAAPLKTSAAAFFFGCCFLILFFLQYKLSHTLDAKKGLLVLALVGGVYFLAMPFFSSDVFLYVFKGKIQVEKGLSPYRFVDYFDTPFRLLSPWIFVPLAYGPLANLVFKLSYLGGLSPFANMYILKALFLLFFIATVMVARRVSGEKNFIFFILSPLILIEGILCAHLDVMPLFFFVPALCFIKKENYPAAFLLLGTAAAFKINYGIFVLPFFLESAVVKGKWRFSPYYALLFALPAAGATAFYPEVGDYVAAIKYVGSLTGISCLRLFAGSQLGLWAFILVVAVLAGYFLFLYVRGRIDFFRFSFVFFIIFLLFNKIFQPWHILPLYALGLFFKAPRFDYFGLVSMLAVYGVFLFFYQWNPRQNLVATLLILLGIVGVLALELAALKKDKPLPGG